MTVGSGANLGMAAVNVMGSGCGGLSIVGAVRRAPVRHGPGTAAMSVSSQSPRVVATAIPLSSSARAHLSELLGPDFMVVDIRAAPPSADVVLVPAVSANAVSMLRASFPMARILVSEMYDPDWRVDYPGPIRRLLDTGVDGYFVAHDLHGVGEAVSGRGGLMITAAGSTGGRWASIEQGTSDTTSPLRGRPRVVWINGGPSERARPLRRTS